MNASKVTLTATGARPGETLDAASSGSGERRSISEHAVIARGAAARSDGRVRRSSPAISAQQQEQRSRGAGVRSACRKARGAGGAANAPQAGPRTQAGPPPGPAPRNADGRVLLGGATPEDKGVWLPGGGGGQTSQSAEPIPFQPWANALLDDRATNELEPHTRCKPSGVARQFLTPYGVEFVELPEIKRILHLRHRRPAHVPRRSTWTAARIRRTSRPTLLRPLDRLVGGRHAGRRHRRLQRRVLDGPARLCRTPRSCTRSRRSPAPTPRRSSTR